MMRSPHDRLSPDTRILLFIVGLGLLVLSGWWMGRIQTAASLPGDHPRVAQIPLEFAPHTTDADFLKNTAWNADGKGEGIQRVARLIYWDFVFLLCYALVLSLACTFAAEGAFRHGRSARALGILLAWGSLLAAAADVVANCAMLVMLHQKEVSGLALCTAKTFAGIEFFLVGLAVTYVLAAMLLSLLGHGATPAPAP